MKKVCLLVGACLALTLMSGCTAQTDDAATPHPVVTTPSSGARSPSAIPTVNASTSGGASSSATPSVTPSSGSPTDSQSGTTPDTDQSQTVPDARSNLDDGVQGGANDDPPADNGPADDVPADPGPADGGGATNPVEEPAPSGDPAPTETIPATVMTPAVEGVGEADAVAALEALGLDAEVSYQASDTVPSGVVISASVGAGTPVTLGTTVTLVVSEGAGDDGLIDVPSYVGTPSDEARAELEAMGLVVVTTAEHSISIAPGSVISQTPDGGQLHVGDTVTLVVSDGPELVAVPDVVGLSGASACEVVDAAGFACQIVCDLENCDSADFIDQVTRIAPGAGTMVYQGFSVTVYVV